MQVQQHLPQGVRPTPRGVLRSGRQMAGAAVPAAAARAARQSTTRSLSFRLEVTGFYAANAGELLEGEMIR